MIDEDFARDNDLDCAVVDHANIIAAERENKTSFPGCQFLPTYAISMQPADDMMVPLFLCTIHFNSLNLALKEGVGADDKLFKSL
jgi:hypothetical protein